jgi:DNA polymerase-1
MADSEKKTDTLILIDGSHYMFRAFHAMPSLSNQHGEPTGAAYGVVNMMRRILDDYDPTHIAFVFDAKGKTFRDDMYAEYKANRPPMPEELREQKDPIRQLVQALGIPLLEVPGVEADDVIGTLATVASAQSLRSIISSGDKDLAQLVDQHVTMVNTMDGTVLDRDGVIGKWGVPPERMIDYLTLVGDTVDNVPGVPKVGPKTAVKWLQAYGHLDGVIEHADEIAGKVGESLRASVDAIPLSKALVTIKCDVELDLGLSDLQRREPDTEKLKELYARFEFKTWLAAVLGASESTAVSPAQIEGTYETILDEQDLKRWIERLAAADVFAFDTETTSLNYMNAEIVGVSFAVESGEAAYVPCAHDYPGAPDQIPRERLLSLLKPLLEDEQHAKVGQNLKYDMSVLANYGVSLKGVRYDTMLESYVVDSTATRHDMDSLALKYLGYKTIHFEDVAGKGAKQLTFNEIDLAEAGPYAAEDADVTLRLHETLWPRLTEHDRLRNLFEEVEVPLVPVLSRIERNGVLVDGDMLRTQSGELSTRMNELQEESWAEAGEKFNLGSPKQIQEILFGKLELPIHAKTPKGQPSTSESALQELAHDYALPRLILEHRGLSKLKSTYTDSLPLCVNERTGRVHTSYHQAVASTGRLSSSDPNLQNIPVRTREGRRIREAFVAPSGYVLVAADYSQIELRIMAHLSGDEGLKHAFDEGADVHSATASEVFGAKPGEVSADQRRSAKAINFGLIYGMSAFGLARQLGIARDEARAYVDLYFSRYPGVKLFMDNTREQAHETGFVETVFGRRLYLPEINARNAARRQYAERTAINAPMQGTAADIIKRAMLSVDRWLQTSGIDARTIMQVHEELVFEVKESQVDDAVDAIRGQMESAADLSVPLVVDVGVAANWNEAHA